MQTAPSQAQDCRNGRNRADDNRQDVHLHGPELSACKQTSVCRLIV